MELVSRRKRRRTRARRRRKGVRREEEYGPLDDWRHEIQLWDFRRLYIVQIRTSRRTRFEDVHINLKRVMLAAEDEPM